MDPKFPALPSGTNCDVAKVEDLSSNNTVKNVSGDSATMQQLKGLESPRMATFPPPM